MQGLSIVLLTRNSETLSRVAGLVRSLARFGVSSTVESISDWDSLATAIERTSPSLIMLDPFIDGRLSEASARIIARIVTRCEVIAYGDFRRATVVQDLHRLLRLGVKHFCTLDHDDAPAELAQLILNVTATSSFLEVVESMRATLSTEQNLFLRYALRRGGENTSISSLADELHVSPRTIRRWFGSLAGITPSAILRWSRVLHVCHALARSNAPASSITQEMGFSSYSDFCRKYRLVTGAPVDTRRRSRLFEVAIAEFVALLEDAGQSRRRDEAG